MPVAVGQPGLFFSSLLLTPGLFAGVAALRGQRGLDLGMAAVRGLAIWAVVVGLGGLLIGARNPWPLGPVFWGLLIVGIALSWMAQIQIKGSEGTLSGEELARIGLLTGVSVAVIYGAYLASGNLALYSQARATANDFVSLVQQGEDLKAFVLTIPIGERPPAGQERSQVEALYNMVTPPADVGEYTAFRNNPLFQLIRMGGKDLKLTEQRISTEFSQGVYYTTIEYRAATPFHSFEFNLGVAGQDIESGGVKRRQWFILRGATKLNESVPVGLSERGEELSRHVGLADQLMVKFVEALDGNKIKDAFLWTRPPEEREALRKQSKLDSPAYTAFVKGKDLGLDEMWPLSGEEGREPRRVIVDLFNPEATRTVATAPTLGVFSLSRIGRNAPRYQLTDDRFVVGFEVRLLVRDSTFPMPRFFGEVAIRVEGKANAESFEELRISDIKVLRASRPPVEDKGGPGRRRPGG
jgi:hypothetical protein